ncbi:pyridoxamine 5'-phosphate oxidase [Nakamurella flavida]|nr:pyridoxamine 5'-phosphate oxidase [Nakamurella flavida]MDP9778092.1 pyridoxamine 5'-phosphate oxidase [Nakamurella flavida]
MSHDRLPDLADMRRTYAQAGLAEDDLAATWPEQFAAWMAQAVDAGVLEPNAMVLATAGPDGDVASRTVLAKGVDDDGIDFFTNYSSAKSRHLDANPRASVTFPWYALERQIQVRGTVHRLSAEATESYWRTRPRASQVGAWTSPQSTVIAGRDALAAAQAEVEERFAGQEVLPVPPFWGGWHLTAESVEFWQGRPSRLHDRLRFRRGGSAWVVERLGP